MHQPLRSASDGVLKGRLGPKEMEVLVMVARLSLRTQLKDMSLGNSPTMEGEEEHLSEPFLLGEGDKTVKGKL